MQGFSQQIKKSWLQDNDIEMYPTHKEKIFVVAERFISTLKKQNLQIYDFIFKTFAY